MKRIYFTITGTNHYYGLDFFEPKMTVRLIKEPDNKCDKEAIRVELEGLGKVGYVANSTYTVIGESFSAGRLYDKMGDTAEGTVLYKLPRGVLCYLDSLDEVETDDEFRYDSDEEDDYPDDDDDSSNDFVKPDIPYPVL